MEKYKIVFMNGNIFTVYKNKKEEKMYNNYNKKTELQIQKDITLSMNPLTKVISDRLKHFNVYITENLTGYDKKIIYDGETIYLIDTKNAEKDNICLNIFNKKYKNNFQKLIKAFHYVPFVLWAKVIKSEFIFYDMKINKNWVYRDIMVEELTKADLKINPSMFKGLYTEEKLKSYLGKPSFYNPNFKINSLIVRSIIEGDLDSTRINFYSTDTSFNYAPLTIVKKDKEKEDLAKTTVEDFIKNKIISNSEFYKIKWKGFLADKGFSLETAKKHEIYKTIVYKELDNWEIELSKIAFSIGVEKKVINKKLKGILPRYVRQIFNLK